MSICLKSVDNLRMLYPDLISKLTPDLILKLPIELITKLPPDPTFKLPPGLPDDKTVCVSVQGYYEPGDGGEGSFFWDSASRVKDNSGTIIKPNAIEDDKPGRWNRIYDEHISVKWFGARGNGVADETKAIENAANAVQPGGELVLPQGVYNVSTDFNILIKPIIL
jgi:hypothetical protein